MPPVTSGSISLEPKCRNHSEFQLRMMSSNRFVPRGNGSKMCGFPPSELLGLPLEIDGFGKLQKYADQKSEPVQIAERRESWSILRLTRAHTESTTIYHPVQGSTCRKKSQPGLSQPLRQTVERLWASFEGCAVTVLISSIPLAWTRS